MNAEFDVTGHYTRDQVAEIINLPQDRRKGGAWATGYSRWNGEVFIFCNVGVAGRTGHDYPNRWDGKLLVWTGKTGSSAYQPMVQEMISGSVPVHLFWRGQDRAPFSYAGRALAVSVGDTIPVEVTWSFEEPGPAPTATAPIQAPEQALADTDAVYRRGPPPVTGSRTLVTADGPTSVYIMRLAGPLSAVLPHLRDGHAVIKVGMSNAPTRRRSELNNGFPPGFAVEWELIAVHEYPSALAAFEAEGRILEDLRLRDRWIGGEFGVVPENEIPALAPSDH